MLWAYSKCLVDVNVESKIRETMIRSFCDLPQFYWENKKTLDEAFEAVNSSNIANNENQDIKVFSDVQRLLILGDFASLFEVVDRWSETQANTETRHMLRFFAHLVIVLKRLGQGQIEDGSLTVRRYCEFLMEANYVQQVAWYVAQLSHPDQVDLYAKFLETLNHDADKRLALSLAVENNLPIHEIISEVVVRIHAYEPQNPDDEDEDRRITVRKIEAIDWLLFDSKQIGEAMQRTNLLVRNLKAMGKDEAAQAAFGKLPDSAAESVIRLNPDKPEQQLVLKEHLCWKTYFSAKDSFNR